MRWMRWHCPPETRFEIRFRVWGRVRYHSVTAVPHKIDIRETIESEALKKAFFDTLMRWKMYRWWREGGVIGHVGCWECFPSLAHKGFHACPCMSVHVGIHPWFKKKYPSIIHEMKNEERPYCDGLYRFSLDQVHSKYVTWSNEGAKC